MKLLAEAAESCRELTIEEDEEDDQLNPSSLQCGEGVLLDLSSQPVERTGALLRRGAAFIGTIAAKGCFCAVVIPEDSDHQLGNGLREHLVRIGRPDARSVFVEHLRLHRVAHGDANLDLPELEPRLVRGTMAELSLLASRIADTGGNDELFRARLGRALEAFRTRSEEISSWVRARDDGDGEHALVLSAAMLAGAHTDAVFAATESLLDVVDSEADRNALQRRGISERLAGLGLVVDGDCHAWFKRPDFDHHVRRYFWRDHPGLRETLRDWIGRIALDPALSEPTRNEVVVRFAEQVLAIGQVDHVWQLVEQWVAGAGEARSNPALGYAAVLLRIGLVDERFGGLFRWLVYRWARNAPLSSSFDVVLINLCERVIAPSFAQSALVRLRHLARRDDAQVAEEAIGRLEVLANNRSFLRRALYKVSYELGKKQELPDVQLFLRIVSPERLVERGAVRPLVADAGVRGQLVTGWRSAMLRDVSAWEGSARRWLEVAADDSKYGARLLDVLVESGRDSTAALGCLYGVARRWMREVSGDQRIRRSRLVAELGGRIDASQELELTATAGETA